MEGLSITGLDDVLKNMQDLALNVQKKHARKAARKAMVPVRDAARENAKSLDDPDTANKIWKNIVIQSGRSRDKSEVKVRVGVKGGGAFWAIHENVERKSLLALGQKRQPNPNYQPVPNDSRYWWLVEFGTSKTAAQPFMRPAMEQNMAAVTEIFAAELNKNISGDLG